MDINANIHIEDHHPIGQIRRIPLVNTKINSAEVSPSNKTIPTNEASFIYFEDRMAPEGVSKDVGSNSTREMWVAREFLDRQAFQNNLAKFAIYGNFTLKHLKTNQTKATS